ncbi:hypothetical protein PBY51_014863 [Eleginops maclovinus]|uniref:Uncharacterized protein n=1 Tax=Eleginops maclovinus TaxID=56733 RepID=A0AAN7X326_ELEMC|nr:hypothetical protein PBY51_014863 [Eleginops maclovinus]
MDPETLLSRWLSIIQPMPACLQGLMPAFIPRSAAKADTPSGHEGRGMHSDPPPSSPLSLWRSRDGGPFMESNQDPRLQIPLFFTLLFTSSPLLLAFFLSFVRGLFAVVEYTVRCSCSLPEGRGKLGRAP